MIDRDVENSGGDKDAKFLSPFPTQKVNPDAEVSSNVSDGTLDKLNDVLNASLPSNFANGPNEETKNPDLDKKD